MTSPGQIIILNGAPRSGKSSIAAIIRETYPGHWINLGVDAHMGMTPKESLPGIGLRPGGERPDLEALLPALFADLYGAIATHSHAGVNVVVDIGHHDAYSRPLRLLPACARQLAGLPVLFVGVRCALEEIMRRRRASEGYVTGAEGESIPAPVLLWQRHVHEPGLYDMDVDTSETTAEACADAIRQRLAEPIARPTAFERLAAMAE